MPEPFKNMINLDLIAHMADAFDKASAALKYHDFSAAKFVSLAGHELETLELKQRADQICTSMKQTLPSDFLLAAAIIHSSLAPVQLNQNTDDIGDEGISGWGIWPITTYAGLYGIEYFDEGLRLLKEATKRLSSEFGIRYFILADPDRCMATIKKWAADENYHVRRLASEGSRPRLPWGMQLPMYVNDPSPLLPLLDSLKDDSEEYVRRSVANNLNDIAKDHPDVVAEIATKWLKDANKNRIRMVKHACRTLLKQGHPVVLDAFGFSPIDTSTAKLSLDKSEIKMGESITFTFELPAFSVTKSKTKQQNLMIDYVIHHQKANGKTTPKVFKWKNLSDTDGSAISASKTHVFKPITTRVYHSGEHFVEILVNGVSAGKSGFMLS
ncbi:DNA alkylation repair protein [Glaciecola sp. MH2013]|uniref:DNA alkylation repair protein n=1 Tax=Glaciecola sp. MH2013 TaxID=2785524 RepID=UPI00189EFA6A|nr:DNA alkylation repair protein [Glaciecola sp. MH2013]MBF7073565.1 DNA alkylation repair protein [Glaciecola sp. MH2013]